MRFPVRFVKDAKSGKVTEDMRFNLASVVDNGLGSKCVEYVDYDASKDASRASVSFIKGATRNAERIELFLNAVDSEFKDDTFVCSTLFRQVTYSLSTQFGVARQEIGEYSNFWTFRRPDQASGGVIKANLLTAAYRNMSPPQPPSCVWHISESTRRRRL